MNLKRFVVLDRDGTINVEVGHLSDPGQVCLLPGAADGLRMLRQLGLGLIVATNQSVIGNGIIDHNKLVEINNRLVSLLKSENVWLDGFYICPHRPDETCSCRKPKIGLMEQAVKEFGFDPAKSFVVGDKISDITFGKNAGSTTILVRTGYGNDYDFQKLQPDFIANDLIDLARLIENLLNLEEKDE